MAVASFVSASREKRSPKWSPKFRLDHSFTKVEHFAINYEAWARSALVNRTYLHISIFVIDE